ncbi:hypothetical protein PHLCEN_2v10941 [Hermanssonia centrifuga]|uniref:Uncharacterized protein n=1 Tax=Hermanssonia centrifuga TaxID=98765 RepID=A0A2R6NLF1_9APHY|nr:hypothetical protein PHLCEN_2v10941 [Hermanssonia centrifuga]
MRERQLVYRKKYLDSSHVRARGRRVLEGMVGVGTLGSLVTAAFRMRARMSEEVRSWSGKLKGND